MLVPRLKRLRPGRSKLSPDRKRPGAIFEAALHITDAVILARHYIYEGRHLSHNYDCWREETTMISIALILAFIIFAPFLLLTLLMGDVPFAVRCYISLFLSTPVSLAVIILALRDKLRAFGREHSRPGIDDVFESLASKFEEEFPNIPHDLDKGTLNIPGKDKNVGDMWFYADGNDITVGVGDLFHVHFPVDQQHPNPVEAVDKAISAALSCAGDFFADRVVLRIKYRGNRPVSARVIDPANNRCSGWTASLGISSILSALLFQKSEIKDFVWSGRYDAEK